MAPFIHPFQVRALLDDSGSRVDDAGPSMAVQVLDWQPLNQGQDALELMTLGNRGW